MSAPVRIADAATVRLLAPGDHVDVIAVGDTSADGTPTDGASTGDPSAESGRPGSTRAARVIATGARVSDVPDAADMRDTGAADGSFPGSGALVVLTVPRSTATALAGAAATSKLAVTLC
ncbi:RcpC/CpaB family pilus assembly protein [Streptomyces sp. SID10853]|uniref:RcpC/CpaB family pilus assembly protein n=1 Tax=Streptomyces sp. SID10853 TaxID=2706028 RepID=UPI0031BA8075